MWGIVRYNTERRYDDGIRNGLVNKTDLTLDIDFDF